MKKAIDFLGFPAKDRVTGFEGVLTSLSFDLYGCIQYVITPQAKDGKVLDGNWFDSNRIVITGNKRVMDIPDYDENYPVLDYGKGAAEKPIK